MDARCNGPHGPLLEGSAHVVMYLRQSPRSLIMPLIEIDGSEILNE
jgi:hypothetical protein